MVVLWWAKRTNDNGDWFSIKQLLIDSLYCQTGIFQQLQGPAFWTISMRDQNSNFEGAQKKEEKIKDCGVGRGR